MTNDMIPRAALDAALAQAREEGRRDRDAEVKRLREALMPFASAADRLVVADDGDMFFWAGNEQTHAVTKWFGPTCFGNARAALATKPGEGE